MQSSSWLFAFMLFNFQGPVLFVHRSELVYYITLFSACQALFSKFFNFFSKPKFQSKSLVFGLLMSFLSSRASLSRWQLIYNIMPKLFCQHLFLKKIQIFFKKVGNSHFFPYLCGFLSFSGTLRFWVFLSKSKIALCLQLFSLLFLILYAIINELFLLCARSSVG